MKKDLTQIEGTVAYVLNQNMNKINFGTLPQAKASLVEVLKSPSIKQRDLADKYIVERVSIVSCSAYVDCVSV